MDYPRKAIVSGLLATAFSALAGLVASQRAEAGAYGMMGPGMMEPGMMGSPRGSEEASPAPVNPARARALLDYLHEQDPACLQCHVVSGASFGPSFASIATHYAGQADAEQLLAQHIAHGLGRMPPGLASDAQAAQLARLILELPEVALTTSSRP
jgi:cytochrome c551/c552